MPAPNVAQWTEYTLEQAPIEARLASNGVTMLTRHTLTGIGQTHADLRDDLESLGIEADENVKDPEDHIAALCETMALIIEATDVDAPRVRQFYARHIHPWAAKFFKELESAGSSDFYKSVGLLGQRFIDLENQYLNIQSH